MKSIYSESGVKITNVVLQWVLDLFKQKSKLKQNYLAKLVFVLQLSLVTFVNINRMEALALIFFCCWVQLDFLNRGHFRTVLRSSVCLSDCRKNDDFPKEVF